MTCPVPPAAHDNPDRPGPPLKPAEGVVIPPERVIYAGLLSREELAAAMLHDSLLWGSSYIVWRSAAPLSSRRHVPEAPFGEREKVKKP